MILTKFINIYINSRNISHYKSKGYICEINTNHKIKIDDLSISSHYKILVKCDVCGNEKYLSYQKYNKNISKHNIYTCSVKCAKYKIIETCKKKYKTEYPNQNELVKNKREKTNIERYNVSNVFELDNVKNKIKNTNLEKYGVEYPQQNKEILEKSNKTNIERYGFERPSKNLIIKNKSIESYKLNLINKFKDLNILNICYDKNNVNLMCDNGHIYDINIKTLYTRYFSNNKICTICNPIVKKVSNLENDLLNFIKNNYDGEIITNDKTIISPFELDIYLPALNLAFEFNGLYWHSENNKDKKYHKIKSDISDENNIQLIHIYEDDWIFKQDIVKSMILNKINKTPNRIYARNCEVKELINNKLSKNFLKENHLQGFVGSKIKVGLYYNGELVSIMTFGMNRKLMNIKTKGNEYEMLRYCNKIYTNVIGGASKLLKYFIKKYEPIKITSYADRSYSNGNIYKKLGFKLSHKTNPNYYYIVKGMRKHRFGFRKDVLVKQGFDPSKTEHEIMLKRKIYRIYNSGNYKFIYDNFYLNTKLT